MAVFSEDVAAGRGLRRKLVDCPGVALHGTDSTAAVTLIVQQFFQAVEVLGCDERHAIRPLPAEETEGVMYYDPAATGERIQNLRKDREVTQEQLAIDLNISDRYMRNLEKGEKVPSVDLSVELRERFGSSLDYIVLGVSASQREQELQDQLQMLRKELKEMQRRILVMLEMLGESA